MSRAERLACIERDDAEYMHRYNEIRLHQALEYQTPGSAYRGDMPRADEENATWG